MIVTQVTNLFSFCFSSFVPFHGQTFIVQVDSTNNGRVYSSWKQQTHALKTVLTAENTQWQIYNVFLSASSTATLVLAFIVNRLDHCSSLYCGLPQVRLQPLDGVLRAAARMIGHISEFMRDILHWLPVRQRIHYRLSTIVWRCVLGIAPTYLLGLLP